MYKGVLVHIAQATLILSQYQVLVVVKCHDCKRRCCQRAWRGYCSGNYWGKKFSWSCWVEESIEETRRRREIIEQLLIRILGETERERARYKTCATSRQRFLSVKAGDFKITQRFCAKE